MSGHGSLRELSQKFCIPLRTLERRCSSEGWRRAVDSAGGMAVAVAAEVAAQQGREMGLTLAERARRFNERVMQESEDHLDRIAQAKQLLAENDISGLKQLLLAWEIPVRVGRESYGLDREESSSKGHLHLHVMLKPEALPQQPILDAEVLDDQALPAQGPVEP